ncbi:unnamed protein product [Mesocestoides corti]|uniref:Charged multivesicular body protein 1a n=1 Tax=Mesocestoides corti TaxID=53468 RepID=A0A158QW67_MESCO|nr:unnamed protein product [Mesocestoides corti]
MLLVKFFSVSATVRFSGKQLSRYAQKAESDSKGYRSKLKKALEAKNVDAARIYAEDSIRKHRESIQYMTMASRLDAVQARVKTATTMKSMTKDIGRVTQRLKSTMGTMNLEQIERVMGEFEKTFVDLDVRTSTVEDSMGSAMATTAPEDEIQNLIKQVAEENGLEVEAAMAGAQVPSDSIASPTPGERTSQADDALTQRFAFPFFLAPCARAMHNT